MPKIVVRRYQDSDREQFGHVRSMTYRGGAPIPPDEPILRDDCLGYLAELDGQIVAAFTALKMTCTIDGSDLPCAGIAAVAVLPEHRGSGVGSALMSQSHQLLIEDGFVMGSLYPFREPFYSKFGYATCGARIKMTVPAHRLRNFKAELPVRKLDHSEWPLIKPCFEAFARRYNGTNIRGDSQWWRTYGGDTPFAIYAGGDPVEGYAMVRLAWDFWAAQEVKEIAWTSRRGYDSILSLLRTLAINKSEVAWYEPFEGPYFSTHLDQGVQMSYEKNIMYRILDVPNALRARRADSEGSFVVSVTDEEVASNNASWEISFSPSESRVAKSSAQGFAINIRQLTQAALGLPSYGSLVNAGLLESHPAAHHFFGSRNVYNPDFF